MKVIIASFVRESIVSGLRGGFALVTSFFLFFSLDSAHECRFSSHSLSRKGWWYNGTFITFFLGRNWPEDSIR